MNKILFGLTSFEKELWNQTVLRPRTYLQLTRSSSTISAARSHPTNLLFQSCSEFLSQYSYQLPRYFTRGVLEKDKKHNPDPYFFLLTETNETPRSRPLPRNRNLIRTLCRGKGVLRQTVQGYVYLDIDNQFILALLPYLVSHGLMRPPYFNLFHSPDGAHIPVIPAREAFFQEIGSIREIGQEFSFEIEGLYSVKPNNWQEIEEIWFFKVKCPELETLRRKYFLPSLPNGHPLIIATAVKPSIAGDHQLPTLRISPTAYAA
jgi:hypothetical protein